MKGLLGLLLLPAAMAAAAVTVAPFAGSGQWGEGGPAIAAQFGDLQGLALDAAGNLYVSDTDRHRVIRITPAGVASTVAGTGRAGFSGDGGPASAAQLNLPYGLAADGFGNLYIADLGNGRTRRVASDGTITTIASSLAAPRNIACDALGNLYVSEFAGGRVRFLPRGGTLTTVAAGMSAPAGLALDSHGILHIAESGRNLIRRLLGGAVSTVLEDKSLFSPFAIAFDTGGALAIIDRSPVVRRFTGARLLDLAGNGQPGYDGDGGRAVQARLSAPHDLAFDAQGNCYLADGPRVRKITPAGMISTVAGDGYRTFVGDGGPAMAASLARPAGLAVDPSDNLYIADAGANRIRRVTPQGVIETVAGQRGPGLAQPSAVAVDTAGNLWVAEAGNPRLWCIRPGGAGDFVPLAAIPLALASDSAGNVFLSDNSGRVFRVAWPGLELLAAYDSRRLAALASDGMGNLFLADADHNTVLKLTGAVMTVVPVAGGLSGPAGLSTDRGGNLYIADAGSRRILRLAPDGAVATIAGGPDSVLEAPGALALDRAGALYVTDPAAGRVWKLTAAPEPPPAVAAPSEEVSVVNAASRRTGPVAPGEIVTITGTGIGASPAQHGLADANGLLPARLGGVQVFFDDTPAPLFSVDANQISAQVPYTVSGRAATHLRTTVQDVSKAETGLAVAAAAPAIFENILNQDGTINTAANPAMRGSLITFFATGEGVTEPVSAAGVLVRAPPPRPVLPVTVTLADVAIQVVYAGAAPGFAGLLQVNARPPAWLLPGTYSLVLKVGGIASPAVNLALY